MTADERASLIIELTQRCPALIWDDAFDEEGDGYLALAIKYGVGKDDWFLVCEADPWREPGGGWSPLIEDAMRYAESLTEPLPPEMSHCHPNHCDYVESRKLQ